VLRPLPGEGRRCTGRRPGQYGDGREGVRGAGAERHRPRPSCRGPALHDRGGRRGRAVCGPGRPSPPSADPRRQTGPDASRIPPLLRARVARRRVPLFERALCRRRNPRRRAPPRHLDPHGQRRDLDSRRRHVPRELARGAEDEALARRWRGHVRRADAPEFRPAGERAGGDQPERRADAGGLLRGPSTEDVEGREGPDLRPLSRLLLRFLRGKREGRGSLPGLRRFSTSGALSRPLWRIRWRSR
jgi:hypothetical protein